MEDVLLTICACLAVLSLFICSGLLVFQWINPCHPLSHAANDSIYCDVCGEQLRTVCECGQVVTGQNFCGDCGLAVSGG